MIVGGISWKKSGNGKEVEVWNPVTWKGCITHTDIGIGEGLSGHTICGNLLCGGDRNWQSCWILDPNTGNFTKTEVELKKKRYLHMCWNIGGEGGDILLLGGEEDASNTTELVSSNGTTSSLNFTLKHRRT